MAKLKSTTVTGNLAVSGNITGTLPAHGNHVPGTQTANNAVYLRNDNTWQTITPAKIGAEAANSNIQAHISSAHAPSNAQKNSDITKAEIEAKLTGTVTTHAHNYASTAVATTSANGLMAAADKVKLNGIATGANNYTHPNDANTRHVTDVEKGVWNGTKAELDALKDQVSQNKPIVITDDTAVGTIAFIDSAISVQEGWLKCDGSSLSTTAYPELFAAIGYIHGGSGTSFKLPDLRVGNLVIEGIDDAETTMDAKVVKRQIGIIKAKKMGKDMLTVAQEWTSFKNSGGEIGGKIINNGSIIKGDLQSIKWLRDNNEFYEMYIDADGSLSVTSSTAGGHVLRIPKNGSSVQFVGNILSYGSGTQTIGLDTTPWKDIYLSGLSKASNGYTKLPNGLKLQWGALPLKFSSVNVKSGTATFPSAFNTILQTVATIGTNSVANMNMSDFTCGCNASATSISLMASTRAGNNVTGDVTIKYFAIGF